MKRHKLPDTIPCPHCDARFTSVDELLKHADVVHDEPPKNRKPNLDEVSDFAPSTHRKAKVGAWSGDRGRGEVGQGDDSIQQSSRCVSAHIGHLKAPCSTERENLGARRLLNGVSAAQWFLSSRSKEGEQCNTQRN